MKKIVVICLIAILGTLASVQMAKAYENTEHGFSITPPAGWQQSAIEGGAEFSPTDELALMNVVIEKTNETLADFAETAKYGYEFTLEDCLTLDEAPVKIGDLNGYYVVFDGYADEDLLKGKIFISVENGKGVKISYLAFESDYDSHIADFDQSAQTFRFTSGGAFSFSLNSTTTIVIVIVIVVVVVLAVVLLLVRRRGKAKTASVQAAYPPPPPPPPS